MFCQYCGKLIKDDYCDCDNDWEDDENEFIPCSGCDGHPACEDFGCAIKNGLGRMVKTKPDWEW
jgi:hypothetical protein